MGIQGLLPHLADSTRDAHISQFENEFVAVDAYCWLHKGIYSCAYELATKKPTVKYVIYCMRYIEMLLHFKVKPILVFDGRHLSSKCDTEKKRREDRKRKYERGKELMKAGNTIEGRKLLGESVDVTHEMALKLIQECRKKNIDCIVAPYEADAQLAFLSRKNIVKCVITEDSDLLAYGSERVMFKMDQTGRGKLIEKSEIYLSLKMIPEEFSEDIFRYMCILSGCDYLPSLDSVGPASSLKFIKMLKGNNIYDVLPKLPIYLNKMKVTVTPEYINGFRVADNTFKHQLVYDPFLRMQVPIQPARNDDDIVGTKLPDDIAFNLAVGNINPITMEKLDCYDPDETGRGFSILWRTDLLPNATPRQPVGSFWHQMSESIKNHRGSLESNMAPLVSNDLKKQRTPIKISRVRNLVTKNNTQKIPDCGFIFDPKIEKKVVSNEKDESNLLKSRYFSQAKVKGREKTQIASASDRRKDESDEDYLQRLYDEYFPLEENENEESDTRKAGGDSVLEIGKKVLNRFCTHCRKVRICCTCLGDSVNVSDSKMLGESVGASECERNENPPVEHFLLDEIYSSQLKKSESFRKEEKQEEEESQGKISPSQSLSLNFTKILSKIMETPKSKSEDENCKTEVVEKENEVVFVGEQEAVRSPSPVFKVQKGNKVLKRNCRLGNISDTAGTPTSVYFDSERLYSSNPQESSRSTPSHRKMPSVRSFNSVPSKSGINSSKSSTINGTLFQFGFKKRRREENESEA